jgi:hypothetical protein
VAINLCVFCSGRTGYLSAELCQLSCHYFPKNESVLASNTRDFLDTYVPFMSCILFFILASNTRDFLDTYVPFMSCILFFILVVNMFDMSVQSCSKLIFRKDIS